MEEIHFKVLSRPAIYRFGTKVLKENCFTKKLHYEEVKSKKCFWAPFLHDLIKRSGFQEDQARLKKNLKGSKKIQFRFLSCGMFFPQGYESNFSFLKSY